MMIRVGFMGFGFFRLFWAHTDCFLERADFGDFVGVSYGLIRIFTD